jgi:hypothetical protein
MARKTDGAIPALEDETREVVPTYVAAHHLMRQEQTLRGWACRENGPIRPRRVNGLLGWPTAEIRQLVGAVK